MSFGGHSSRYRDSSHRDRSAYTLPGSRPPWLSGHQPYTRTTTPTISSRVPTGPATRLPKRIGVIIACEYWKYDEVQLPKVDLDARRIFHFLKGSLLTLYVSSVVNSLQVVQQYNEILVLTDASLDLGDGNVPMEPTTSNIVRSVFFCTDRMYTVY
jgi:hypothetical protein